MNQELETIAANLAHQIESVDADQLQALCRDIVERFLILRTCCEEALNGDWEVNDEGFEDMKAGIDTLFTQWEPGNTDAHV